MLSVSPLHAQLISLACVRYVGMRTFDLCMNGFFFGELALDCMWYVLTDVLGCSKADMKLLRQGTIEARILYPMLSCALQMEGTMRMK